MTAVVTNGVKQYQLTECDFSNLAMGATDFSTMVLFSVFPKADAADGEGKSSCLLDLQAGSSTAVQVIDESKAYAMPIASFQNAVASGIDRSTMVAFEVEAAEGSDHDDKNVLLDFQAGATKDRLSDVQFVPGDGGQTSDSAANCIAVAVDIRHRNDVVGGASSDDEVDGFEMRFVIDDEGQVVFQDVLRDSLEEEVLSFSEEVQAANIRKMHGFYRCPLCPFRSFNRLCQLADHLRKHHVVSKQFVCSGTKQMKVILALHDADAVQRVVGGD